MNIVNGKEREVVELLRGYGLNSYEAKVYFTLLAVGESKANDIAHKSGVPQSKVYDVLANLCDGGFAEQAEDAKPALYKAYILKDTTEKVVAKCTKEIADVQKNRDRLNRVLEAVAPIHKQHETYRLFAPRYRVWKREKTNLTATNSIASAMLNKKDEVT